jgi:protein CpxP
MKKLVGLSVIIIFFSITMNAQMKNMRNKKGLEFTTEQRATLQAKKMALKLDLNENQQKDIQKLMLKYEVEREQRRATFKNNKAQGVVTTSEEQFNFEKKRLDRKIAHKAEMKKILTKTQLEKWENEMMGKIKKRNRGKGDRNQRGIHKNLENPK